MANYMLSGVYALEVGARRRQYAPFAPSADPVPACFVAYDGLWQLKPISAVRTLPVLVATGMHLDVEPRSVEPGFRGHMIIQENRSGNPVLSKESAGYFAPETLALDVTLVVGATTAATKRLVKTQ
jgi:hypothetical protein